MALQHDALVDMGLVCMKDKADVDDSIHSSHSKCMPDRLSKPS